MDMLHKIIAPKTYPCHLCDITYGVFSIEPRWKTFIEAYAIPMKFLHKDEWNKQYNVQSDLPAIFIKNGDTPPTVFLSTDEMQRMDLDDLINFLKRYELEVTG